MSAHIRWGLAGVFLSTWLIALVKPAAAQVSVTSAVPNSAPQGTVNLIVKIGGSGFKRGASSSFLVTGTTNPGGITVNSTTFVRNSEVDANITITADATVSGFDVLVTSGGRTGKGTDLFAVLSCNGTCPSAGGSSATLLINANQDVLGDGLGTTPNDPDLYVDFLLPPPNDACVSGSVNADGFTVFYLDRQLSDGSFCNTDPTVLGSSPARTYLLYLDNSAGACDQLAASVNTAGYCTVAADVGGYQRIALGGPFASKPSSSLRFAFDHDGSRWSVIPDKAATVQSPDSNTRVITSPRGATATLNLVGPNGPTPVTGSFPFTYSLTVKRSQ